MPKIKIVTDSTCDLPQDIVKELDITVAPLTVRFGQEIYRDGVDITSEAFFYKLKNSKTFPTTSQVSVGQFTEIFEELSKDYDEIVGIFISSKLSGTYQSAVIAKNVLGLQQIHILDSRAATLALGLMVMEAAKMAREGKDADEIKNRITYISDNLHTVIILGTLTYLQKGGRIGSGTALVGNLLNIMPILTFNNGEVKMIDKIRGKKRMIKWIMNHMESLNIDLAGKSLGINYVGCDELVEELKQAISGRFKVSEFIVGTVGSVIGTYSGPDLAIGVYIY
ncbi:MAG: DegV family protein [Firmicutes bacterium]|nr:DegV family protein [Bacillota bacterium]MDI6704951.1 DegV family protein [Bacillota bacterium]